jgi:hypothetical protein
LWGKERGLESITRGSSIPCTKLINGFILYGDMAPNCAAWNSPAPGIYALHRNIKHIMHSLGSSRKLATQGSLEFSNKCVVWNSFASLIILDNLQSRNKSDINHKINVGRDLCTFAGIISFAARSFWLRPFACRACAIAMRRSCDTVGRDIL